MRTEEVLTGAFFDPLRPIPLILVGWFYMIFFLRNREVLQKLLQESAIIAEDVVAGLEAKTDELYSALEKKTEELNAKIDLLEVNNAVMRDLTKTHQTSLQQMAVKVEEAERKVETMAAFEKCLISTMLNPDLEETVKVVKMQQEKILELERKLEEKSKVEENATPPSIGENLMKLRGINISLVKETPKTREGILEQGRERDLNLRNDSHLKEDSSEKVDQPAQKENKAVEEGEGGKPKEMVKLAYGKVDVVRSRLVEESGEGGEVGLREVKLSSNGELRRHPDQGELCALFRRFHLSLVMSNPFKRVSVTIFFVLYSSKIMQGQNRGGQGSQFQGGWG